MISFDAVEGVLDKCVRQISACGVKLSLGEEDSEMAEATVPAMPEGCGSSCEAPMSIE